MNWLLRSEPKENILGIRRESERKSLARLLNLLFGVASPLKPRDVYFANEAYDIQ
jgi:hypothetical protein